jgi:hypothetical protein
MQAKLVIFALLWVLPVGASKRTVRRPGPTADQELKIRENMVNISRQLGVTCNYCHDVKNFRNSSLKTWKTAKDHIRIVDLLNSKGFTKGPRVDCYLCHRGQAVPDYREGSPKN